MTRGALKYSAVFIGNKQKCLRLWHFKFLNIQKSNRWYRPVVIIYSYSPHPPIKCIHDLRKRAVMYLLLATGNSNCTVKNLISPIAAIPYVLKSCNLKVHVYAAYLEYKFWHEFE